MNHKLKKCLRNLAIKKMIFACISLGLLAGIISPFILSVGCQNTKPLPPLYAPQVAMNKITTEPIVRIRIAIRKPHITVTSTSSIQIGIPKGNSSIENKITCHGLTTISYDGKQWIIQPRGQDAFSWAVPNITISSASGKVALNKTNYPGHFTLHPRTPLGATPTAYDFDVVNHVNLEQYLPGVLHKELYPNWHIEAYRAQAIAARSYAISKMDTRKKRHFDLEASQASQAYAGSSTRYNARQATADTKGIVLSYNGNICQPTIHPALVAFHNPHI